MRTQFVKHADCVVDQYAKYVVVDDIHINSKLTEGEDVADLGGTSWRTSRGRMPTRASSLRPLDGLTPDQRFFVASRSGPAKTIVPRMSARAPSPIRIRRPKYRSTASW